MWDTTTLRVRQARVVPASLERAWALLDSPAVWSLQPGGFSFGVALPDEARQLRVVLAGRRSGGLTAAVFEVSEEVPGRSVTLRRASGSPPGNLELCLSAAPGRRGTKIAITVQDRVSIFSSGEAQANWQDQLKAWVGECAAVIAGRRLPAGDGIPADIAAACTARHPAQDAGKAASTSASTLISAPADRVWRILRDPAVSQAVDPSIIAAGLLPGMPAGQAGEVKYVIRRTPGGGLRAGVVDARVLDEGRAVLARDVASGSAYGETQYEVEPDQNGTRLTLTTRITAPTAASLQQDLDTRVTTLASRYKTAIEAQLR